MTHRRRVLFLKPDLFLVVDDFAATDGKAHEVEVQFLLNTPGADLDKTHAAIGHRDPGAPTIAIVPLRTDGLVSRIAQGETEPHVRGFIPRGFEKLHPAPAVLYTRRFDKQLTLAWLLVPFRSDTPPVRLLNATADGDAIRASLRLADGGKAQVSATPASLSWTDPNRVFSRAEPALPNVE